jgi:hypothetical protein
MQDPTPIQLAQASSPWATAAAPAQAAPATTPAADPWMSTSPAPESAVGADAPNATATPANWLDAPTPTLRARLTVLTPACSPN